MSFLGNIAPEHATHQLVHRLTLCVYLIRCMQMKSVICQFMTIFVLYF